MSSIYFRKGKPYNKFAILRYQQILIEKNFPFLKCSITNKVLTCTGWIQPEDSKGPYKIKIEYVAGCEPKSSILHPKIEPSKEIHMYKDYSLCLYYPPDMKWDEKTRVYQYTIPWISEWIIFYEIYLLNGGEWEGRESPTHITEDDKNINKDFD
jgi:hypothetical protein